jgi:hypothetical protein
MTPNMVPRITATGRRTPLLPEELDVEEGDGVGFAVIVGGLVKLVLDWSSLEDDVGVLKVVVLGVLVGVLKVVNAGVVVGLGSEIPGYKDTIKSSMFTVADKAAQADTLPALPSQKFQTLRITISSTFDLSFSTAEATLRASSIALL